MFENTELNTRICVYTSSITTFRFTPSKSIRFHFNLFQKKIPDVVCEYLLNPIT